RDLAADQVDQPPVDEVRADTARSLLVQHERFALDPRKTADARADRAAGAEAGRLVHVEEARVLDRLPCGIEAVDDERIDLPLDLVIDPLAGIEAVLMVRRLDLAGDAALLVRRVELCDRARAALAGEDIGPARLDVAAQRGDEAQSGYDHSAHTTLQIGRASCRERGSIPVCDAS